MPTATSRSDATSEFETLTTPHMPRLYRLGLRLTRDPQEASDLVQEALCRAWATWDRFDRSGNLGAYLSRIIYNLFVSRHRHARVVRSAALREDLSAHLFDRARLLEAANPETRWHQAQLGDEVLHALDRLPATYRRAIELVDLDGMSYREAADELGIPLGTVMSRLHRARRSLRPSLETYASQRSGAASPA